jgi:hypothetical protein
MSKKIWESEAVSIIVLPSGGQGREILDLAQEWSRSWLLTPALWMLADEIPEFDPNVEVELQVPPKLTAYLLGRDLEQNPVREEVDVFWTLGSQPFHTVRFIAVRTEQDSELMRRTTIGAQTAATFIEMAIPQKTNKTNTELLGSYFTKYNLVISPTNERGVLEGVLNTFWDANLIAAAEDRATPRSTDSFVKVEEKFIGFALAHIATTAGLWAGLPISSAEINSEKTQHRQARLQRVFVRGVTSDTLSADVAHWALQKLNHSDANFEIGAVEGHNVRTIASEAQNTYMHRLVEFIMRGPAQGEKRDNFIFSQFDVTPYLPSEPSRFTRFMLRVQDMAEGLFALPRWIGASAAYRMDLTLDGEASDDVLYNAIPNRLAPRVKLPPIDVLIASLKPKLPMPTPELWKFVRESISSAIDAPTPEHPDVLKGKNDELLVFATIEQVLPDPEAFWEGTKYEKRTEVPLKRVGWLGAEETQENITNLQKRIDELAPGIADARAQLSETQNHVTTAESELQKIVQELSLIEKELESDEREAKKLKSNHTHKLPRGVTDAAKRPSQGAKKGSKMKHTDLALIANTETYSKKPNFFKRIFGRKGKA